MASSATAGNEKHRRPRITSISNSKPTTHKPTNFSSQFSPRNDESSQPPTKMPKKKKTLRLLILKAMGCRGDSSSPAMLPAAIQSAAVWEDKKVKRKRKKKQSKSRSCTTPPNVVVEIPDVCCTPPRIGFAYDVVPPRAATRADAERKSHREHSRAARRTAKLEHVSPLNMPPAFDTTCSQTNVSNARQYSRLRRHSPGLPEIIMFDHNMLLERDIDRSDQYGDWRLNIDSMSYEELLKLSDSIGYVGASLREDEILSFLKKPKNSIFKSFALLKSRDKDWKCSICQEESKGDDELKRLDCGHYHHIQCIKQWLLQKNVCPVCKAVAIAAK